MTTNFCIKVITWNTAEGLPPNSLSRLLNLEKKMLPDLYAIGLQELTSTASSILSSVQELFYNHDEAWTKAISKALVPHKYAQIKNIKMMGMQLSLYVKKQHLPYIRNVECDYSRSGGWGVKGGVSVRMDIYDVNVCFVNCHFQAHLGNFVERLQDYVTVIERQHFKEKGCASILEHDYVFWFGDLNFRIDILTKSEIENAVKAKAYDEILAKDQLRNAMNSKLILVDFQEADIRFPPTYKFNKHTDVYDTSKKQRKPAYTDRILYNVCRDAFEGLELSVRQLSYSSVMEYQLSDHKPVQAEFCIQVFEHPAEHPVMFEPLGTWYCARDNTVCYLVSTDFPVNAWDWIALYREHFKSPQDYETFVWASTQGEDDENCGSLLYQVTFDKSILKSLAGNFHLGYFSSEKNCLMGWSEMFQISLTEESSDSEDDALPTFSKITKKRHSVQSQQSSSSSSKTS